MGILELEFLLTLKKESSIYMQYLEIANISLLGSALNQEDFFEDSDRDDGSLIKTTTCAAECGLRLKV